MKAGEFSYTVINGEVTKCVVVQMDDVGPDAEPVLVLVPVVQVGTHRVVSYPLINDMPSATPDALKIKLAAACDIEKAKIEPVEPK